MFQSTGIFYHFLSTNAICKSQPLASIIRGPSSVPLKLWPLPEKSQGDLPNLDHSPGKIKTCYLNWSPEEQTLGFLFSSPIVTLVNFHSFMDTRKYKCLIKPGYLLIWFVLAWLGLFCVGRELPLENNSNILEVPQRGEGLSCGPTAMCWKHPYPLSIPCQAKTGSRARVAAPCWVPFTCPCY